MGTPANTTLVQTFLALLEHLNLAEKKAIINQLSVAVKESANREAEFLSLYGAFQSSGTADELISEIRESRLSGRVIEEF